MRKGSVRFARTDPLLLPHLCSGRKTNPGTDAGVV